MYFFKILGHFFKENFLRDKWSKRDSCNNGFQRMGEKRTNARHSQPPRLGLGLGCHWECRAGSQPAAPAPLLLRGQGRAQPLLTVCPLCWAPIKAALSKVFRVAASLGSSYQHHSSGNNGGGLLLWVNCLPLQLMNLCGLSFVCFPGVRINERSCTSAAEERREKMQGRGGLGKC